MNLPLYTGIRYTTKFGVPVVKGSYGYGFFKGKDGYWYISDIADDAINQYTIDWFHTGNSYPQSQDSVLAGITET